MVVQRWLDVISGEETISVVGDAFLTPVAARRLASTLIAFADGIDGSDGVYAAPNQPRTPGRTP